MKLDWGNVLKFADEREYYEVLGITIKINYEIADKKEYEVIEQNRAIVSNYDGTVKIAYGLFTIVF